MRRSVWKNYGDGPAHGYRAAGASSLQTPSPPPRPTSRPLPALRRETGASESFRSDSRKDPWEGDWTHGGSLGSWVGGPRASRSGSQSSGAAPGSAPFPEPQRGPTCTEGRGLRTRLSLQALRTRLNPPCNRRNRHTPQHSTSFRARRIDYVIKPRKPLPLPPGSSAPPRPREASAVVGGAARRRPRADPAAAGEPGIAGLRMPAVQSRYQRDGAVSSPACCFSAAPVSRMKK
uniref:uncharacterized protein LOC125414280 n=1 Tax=Myodes glareolus TaxID=447135 RepID=UPI00201FB5E7|nr:uncharacterized protein LOC125414280 [Myodes glareolus]